MENPKLSEITLRDLFAGLVAAVYISKIGAAADTKRVAELSYGQADALLAEREKKA